MAGTDIFVLSLHHNGLHFRRSADHVNQNTTVNQIRRRIGRVIFHISADFIIGILDFYLFSINGDGCIDERRTAAARESVVCAAAEPAAAACTGTGDTVCSIEERTVVTSLPVIEQQRYRVTVCGIRIVQFTQDGVVVAKTCACLCCGVNLCIDTFVIGQDTTICRSCAAYCGIIRKSVGIRRKTTCIVAVCNGALTFKATAASSTTGFAHTAAATRQ